MKTRGLTASPSDETVPLEGTGLLFKNDHSKHV